MSAIKNNKLRLEEDVSINVERQATRGLNATETGGAGKHSKIDEVPRDRGGISINVHSKVREGGAAWENKSTKRSAELRTRDSGIVCLRNGVCYEQQSGACVCNPGEKTSRNSERCGSDGQAVRCKSPEPLRWVDRGESDIPSELAGVNLAKRVGTWLPTLEKCGEESKRQPLFHSGRDECLGLGWAYY